MLCTHKTTILCQFGSFVTSFPTHISINSQPFLVGIVSPDSWMKYLHTTRLTLLQTAVHNIPECRMVETMEEFISLSSTTPGPTMGYDNYLTLLQNACITYDGSQKSGPSPSFRAAYQHDLSPDHCEYLHPQDYSSSGTTCGGIDMPAEEFYQVHTTNLNRPPTVSTLTPRKPLTSPPAGRPTPEGLLDPSTSLQTSTNF